MGSPLLGSTVDGHAKSGIIQVIAQNVSTAQTYKKGKHASSIPTIHRSMALDESCKSCFAGRSVSSTGCTCLVKERDQATFPTCIDGTCASTNILCSDARDCSFITYCGGRGDVYYTPILSINIPKSIWTPTSSQ